MAKEGRNGGAHASIVRIVETLNARFAVVVIRHAKVDLLGHNVAGVLLESLETGNGHGAVPVELNTKPHQHSRSGKVLTLQLATMPKLDPAAWIAQ